MWQEALVGGTQTEGGMQIGQRDSGRSGDTMVAARGMSVDGVGVVAQRWRLAPVLERGLVVREHAVE